MDLHYSQTSKLRQATCACFTTLWIYTILKPALRTSCCVVGFTTLWIYTILKLGRPNEQPAAGFTTLWIYTILKLCQPVYGDSDKFHYLMDLHYSQTNCRCGNWWRCVSLPYGFTLFSNRLVLLMLTRLVSLPYGFTLFSNCPCVVRSNPQFHYLMDLHYSQTHRNNQRR